MAASGARMVEVGTTNRTRLSDYKGALDAGASLVMKVHRSNFDVVGFTEEVGIAELAGLCHPRAVPLLYDLGSGLLRSRPGLGEACVTEALEAGADLVLFSGDKLLGGPQCGVVAGRRVLVERLRRHPLMRMVRPGKLTLLALEATLRAWARDPEGAPVPAAEMLSRSPKVLRERAESLASALRGVLASTAAVSVVAVDGLVGGGSAPGLALPGFAVAVRPPSGESELAEALRRGDPAVVGRIEGGALLLDVRTLLAGDEGRIVDAFRRAGAGG